MRIRPVIDLIRQKMGMNRPEAAWLSAVQRRNSYWPLLSRQQQNFVGQRIERLKEQKVDVMLTYYTKDWLRAKFGITDAKITSISFNGSYVYGLSATSKPQDMDATVEIEHPFLMASLIDAFPLALRDGTPCNSIGLISTGLHGRSRHPKYLNEVYSHLTAGISLDGQTFHRSPLNNGELIMQADRLLDLGMEQLKLSRNFRKAMMRFAEARAILNLTRMGGSYREFVSDIGKIDMYSKAGRAAQAELEEELKNHILGVKSDIERVLAGDPVVRAQHGQAGPEGISFDDWTLSMIALRNKKRSEADERSVMAKNDWVLDCMLAGVTLFPSTREQLAARYPADASEQNSYIHRALQYNLRFPPA